MNLEKTIEMYEKELQAIFSFHKVTETKNIINVRNRTEAEAIQRFLYNLKNLNVETVSEVKSCKCKHPSEIIVYKGKQIPKISCTEKDLYYYIPRSFLNNFGRDGSDLILKSDCQTLDEYIKDLEHYKTTTVGLWATDRPDLVDEF